MLIMADAGRQEAVREALRGLVEVPFGFSAGGSQIVYDEKQ